jgi:hypothetical protein
MAKSSKSSKQVRTYYLVKYSENGERRRTYLTKDELNDLDKLGISGIKDIKKIEPADFIAIIRNHEIQKQLFPDDQSVMDMLGLEIRDDMENFDRELELIVAENFFDNLIYLLKNSRKEIRKQQDFIEAQNFRLLHSKEIREILNSIN